MFKIKRKNKDPYELQKGEGPFIQQWLYNFYWNCCESHFVFVNRKNEIVAIVDMYGKKPLTYLFYRIFYKLSNDVEATKADYLRLYPKESKNIQFQEDIKPSEDNKKNTLRYYIETENLRRS